MECQVDTENLKLPTTLGDLEAYNDALASCMAEHSALAYKGHRDIAESLINSGFDRVVIFREGGTNAYLARCASDNDSGGRDWVLAWRGTESDYQDIIADVTFFKRTSDYREQWRVHGGFLSAMEAVWGSWWDPKLPKDTKDIKVLRAGSPGITEIIAEKVGTGDRILVTGHSLGGALAQLAAFYIHRDLSSSIKKVAAVYTFGSPRVFGIKQAKYLNKELPYPYFRVVNCADIVPHVPPLLLGFRHSGKNIYIQRNGELHKNPSWAHVFWDVGWRQGVLVAITLPLVWCGVAYLELLTSFTFGWYVKLILMGLIAAVVVMLLPKILHFLPLKLKWRLVKDHFMKAYKKGVG